MERYTESEHYDLRKPVPLHSSTNQRWGTDLNSAVANTDAQIYQQQQQNVTAQLLKSGIETRDANIQTLIDNRITELDQYAARIYYLLENVIDCETSAAYDSEYMMRQLENIKIWCELVKPRALQTPHLITGAYGSGMRYFSMNARHYDHTSVTWGVEEATGKITKIEFNS